MTDITVTRNDAESRYEIRRDDLLAGYASVELRPGEIRFTHTEIDPAFRGHGLATRLVHDAVADAVQKGDVIVPFCPFVASYLKENDVPGAEVRWPDPPEID